MQQRINFTAWRKINVVFIYFENGSHQGIFKLLIYHCPTVHHQQLEEAARRNILEEMEVKIIFNYLVLFSVI